jgi:hypothetical protein
MTAAEKIFEDFIGDAVGYGLVKYSVIEAIKHAIQLGNDEVLQTTIDASDEIQALRTRLAELEKDNKELREGHYANVTDAYDAGHEDGHYGAHGVILYKYLDPHDYYTKTFKK